MENASAAGPVRPVAVPARLRPLLRLPRRRDRPVPPRARRTTTTASTRRRTRRGRLPPERGPGRPRDRVRRTTRSRSGPTARSSSTSRSARRTRRTRRRAEYLEKYRGRFDEGWDVARERVVRAPESSSGCVPADTELAPRNPGRRAVGRRCPRTTAASRRGCRRRSPASSTTPTRRSAGSSTSSTRLGRARQHDDRPALRQRREPGGRPVRRPARDEVLQLHPRDARRGGRPPRRHRRPEQPHATTRGAGPRPATRRSSGTSRTPTRAASTCRCIVHWPARHRRRAAGCATSSTT